MSEWCVLGVRTNKRRRLTGFLVLLLLWGMVDASPAVAQGPADDAHNQRHGPAVDSESLRLSPAGAQKERAEFTRALQARRPALAAAARTLKVYVLDFNPVQANGQALTQYETGWYDPDALMGLYGSDLLEASGARLGIQIVTHLIIDGYPAKPNFTFTNDTYLGCLNDGSPAYCLRIIDYRAVLNQVYAPGIDSACVALAHGNVDEVWLWGGPYFGYWEYVIVSPRTLCAGVSATFTVMGFSYQRSDAEMLHDLGHRAEDVLQPKLGLATWDRFDGQRIRYHYAEDAAHPCPPAPEGAPPEVDVANTHAGNVHFPPNALCHYQYDRDLAVWSDALDWQNYPTLTGSKTPVNNSTWGANQRGFLLWWFGQFPRNSTYALADWWTLLFERADFPFSNFLPLLTR